MAQHGSKPISNLAVAFATQSASVDIPKSRDAGHQGNNQNPPPAKHQGMLLTPPNSISPTLPPHKLRSSSTGGHQQIDSDIDLQDAVDHAASHGQPQALSTAALSNLESTNTIQPAILARYYLPEFMLAHGPMAIRHLLGHLTQTVPGFARITPAKARRIVVSALEYRFGGGEMEDVIFEKVGWGRWDARIRGQPPREGQVPSSGMQDRHLSPPASLSGSYAMSNAGGLQIPQPRYHGNRPDMHSGASWTGNSTISSRDEDMEDMNMAEHEADKMSLDGRDEDTASSHAGPDDFPISDNPDDATDEEDWAKIGPQALRQASALRSNSYVDYNNLSYNSSRVKPSTGLMKTAPSQRRASSHHTHSTTHRGISYPGGIVPPFSRSHQPSGFTNTNKHAARDPKDVESQELEAIEALLAMGSM